MDTKFFTLENTEGFTQDELDYYNDKFPEWAAENGFDIENSEDDLKNGIDRFLP